eukprot:c4642_g1_i2.p1 GENE.c4642_g1_i2~~c4642_g1_i2.p1  ORF type:complete len:460 (+),score=135.88 c4642_g1_i2:135-1514(+)
MFESGNTIFELCGFVTVNGYRPLMETEEENPLKCFLDEEDSTSVPETICGLTGLLSMLLILVGIGLLIHNHLPFEEFSAYRLGVLFLFVGLVVFLFVGIAQSDSSSSVGKFEFRRINNKFKKYQKSLDSSLKGYALPLPDDARKLLKAKSKGSDSGKGGSTVSGLSLKKYREQTEAKITEIVRREVEKGTAANEIESLLRPKVFVIEFEGDIQASGVDVLRKQISILLCVATKYDEIVCVLTSGGGLVHTYGLAAAQLGRIRSSGIKLTVCVDTVAASGGYMMACVGDQIVAAPTAFVGSIGVVSYRPNFQKLLNKAAIDVYLMTAGRYKRTVDVVGDVTEEGLAKAQEELLVIHESFKSHVKKYRPKMDIEAVSTGECWIAAESVEKQLNLIDIQMTSDEYIQSKCKSHDVLKLKRKKKKGFDVLLENLQSSVRSRILAWTTPSTTARAVIDDKLHFV